MRTGSQRRTRRRPACRSGPWRSALLAALAGCGGADEPAAPAPAACSARTASFGPAPACGSHAGGWEGLVPGKAWQGFAGALAAKAERLERQFHALNAFGTGGNADASVPVLDREARALVEAFVTKESGWDFEAATGKPVTDAIASWAKVAGAYAGPGVAADALRYATLRDVGADCAEIDRARANLEAGLDLLHAATAITGIEGGIARALASKGLPGDGAFETTPLFDAAGSPLPAEKNNGTWREDASPGGDFAGFIWEDSCSRDMLVGWVMGYATAWEAVRFDPAVSESAKHRLQRDAATIVRSLMKVGDEGYDLEIRDADGRVTFFGYLHEDALDRTYVTGLGSGFQAIMALGIVGGLAFVAEAPDVDAFVAALTGPRRLPELARDNMLFVDLGVGSNFSSYNMAFLAGWLAHRYLCNGAARAAVRDAVRDALYARPGADRQPAEQRQSLYDLVYVATQADARPGTSLGAVDETALARGVATLAEFPDAPFWELGRRNCDDAEIAAKKCLGDDNSEIVLLGNEGWGDTLVAASPIPMRIRPASNYFWRSNPYEPNGGGDGGRLLPASDFRMVYWLGRFLRR
jgi:hypothetical protein